MVFKFSTLKKTLCTLAIGSALLLGATSVAQAQRHRHGPPPWAPAYGYRNNRPYGQLVSERVHRRNQLRRQLRENERLDRRDLNNRLRYERRVNGNNPDFRDERRQERESLRVQQREDRGAFRDNWKVQGRGNGRGRH
ncbi:MAG: hypothetical protein DMF68_10470 [Acidobacteria bacterium]|nr:MAG: hypothetical protein DMF68_10470 [Acidobacteriota bacterium]